MNTTTIKIGANRSCSSVKVISDAMGIMSSQGFNSQVIEWAAKTNNATWQASVAKAQEGVAL